MKSGLLALVALAASLVGGAAAEASTLEFTLTGGVFGIDPAIFTLNRDTKPSQSNAVGFGINGVPIYTNGAATDYNLGFESQQGSASPFFEYARAGFADYATGPEALFSGTPANPQFKVGDFTLTDVSTGTPLNVDIAPIPEPSSWLLMIAGLGGVGVMLRQARSRTGLRQKGGCAI